MDFEKLSKTVDEIRSKPARTIGFLTLFMLLTIGAFWANSFFGELGRQQASQLGEDHSGLQPRPQVRVTYYRFEGPLLLTQVLAGSAFSPRDGFEFSPIWVENGVHNDLSDILEYVQNRSDLRIAPRPGRLPYDNIDYTSRQADGDSLFDWRIPDEIIEPNRRRDQLRAQFRGVAGALRGPNFTGKLDLTDLIARVRSRPDWTMDVRRIEDFRDSDAIPWHAVSFFGPLRSGEAVHLVQDPLSKRLLQENPTIGDLVFLDAGVYHESYAGTVLVRELKLVAVGIENVGDKPLGIDSLMGYEIRDDPFALRSPDQQRTGLAARKRFSRRSPVETLRPGEHLIVPLAIELGIGTPTAGQSNYEAVLLESSFPQPWWRALQGAPTVSFQILQGVDKDLNADVTHFEVETDLLERKPNIRSLTTDVYYLGNSAHLTEVIFRTASGREPYQIRRFDPANLAARGAFEVGSCPILYVKLPNGNTLRRPVLVNAVTRSRTLTERVTVPEGTTSILLVEEEDEISYIDAVALEVQDGRRSTRYVPEGNADVARVDEEFREMPRGDSLRLRFNVPPTQSGRYTLVVTGFYVPNALRRPR